MICVFRYNSDHFSRLYDLSNKIDSTELRRFIFDRALENLKQIVDGSWFLNLAEDQIKVVSSVFIRQSFPDQFLNIETICNQLLFVINLKQFVIKFVISCFVFSKFTWL